MTIRRDQLSSRELEYYRYIEMHVSNVRMVWEAFQKHTDTKLFIADDCNYHTMNGLVWYHDQSKFSDREFHGYRRNFYPEKNELVHESEFENAWNHHQKANPHHWDYWVMIQGRKTKVLPMPSFYVLEMLMDWTAMSIQFGDVPSDWYRDNRNKMRLHSDTEEQIANWMPIFDDIYSKLKGKENVRS